MGIIAGEPEPLVVRAMRGFKAQLLAGEAAQMQEMARRWLGVELALEGQIQALADEAKRIQDAGETLSDARVWRMQRAKTLLAQAMDEFDQYAAYAGGLVTQQQKVLTRTGVRHAQEAIQASYFPRVGVSFERLPVEAVENMVGIAGNGKPLGQLLKLRMVRDEDGKALPGVWTRMVTTLVNNTATGTNPRATARQMRDDLAAGLQKALVIARTEQLRVYRQASLDQYVASGVVTGQKRLSAHDDRVCAACIADDGHLYSLNAVIPDHPQGRCTSVPVVKGMRETTWTAGEAWFKQQDADVQRAILGGGKWDAWQAGEFKFGDLVTQTYDGTWGGGVQPTSLTELLRRAKQKREQTFPDGVTGLETVQSLGGSTGAMLVRDPETGRLYVMKRGASAEHLREEALTDSAYQALGVAVPEFQVYETDGGPVKLSAYIQDARTLRDVYAGGDKALIAGVTKQLQDGFAADAILGNWDVIGLNQDNILIDKDGKVWRIDNGGGLRFRAQGAQKGTAWGGYPLEFWTLRDARINGQTASLFGGMGWNDILGQVEAMAGKRDDVLALMSGDMAKTMAQRFDIAADFAKFSRTLQGDRWVDQYIDGFARHSVGIRQAGVIGKLPERLTHKGVEVIDQAGKVWDSLRGRGSVMYDVQAYINGNGGDYGIVDYWSGAQAGSSWSAASQANKWRLAQLRGGNTSEYFWLNGVDAARAEYDKTVRKLGEKYENTLQMWHAFTFETMRTVDFERNVRSEGYVEVVRTEPRAILEGYGAKIGVEDTMLRGGCESGSLFQTIVVAGNELTLQRVPHHRVFGLYFTERKPGTGQTMFYGDRENEIVFMPEGIPFTWVGSVSSGESVAKYWKGR